MPNKTLSTVGQVIEALGGTGSMAKLTRRTASAVSNWRKAGVFPAGTISVINGSLDRIGRRAPPKLFGIEAFDYVRTNAAIKAVKAKEAKKSAA
jgi:hypothetical protein